MDFRNEVDDLRDANFKVNLRKSAVLEFRSCPSNSRA